MQPVKTGCVRAPGEKRSETCYWRKATKVKLCTGRFHFAQTMFVLVRATKMLITRHEVPNIVGHICVLAEYRSKSCTEKKSFCSNLYPNTYH